MTEKCAACGFERKEHSYNGACYGVCGEFISEIAQLRALVQLADNIRAAQRAYMADRGNGAKGQAVGEAAAAYDLARASSLTRPHLSTPEK